MLAATESGVHYYRDVLYPVNENRAAGKPVWLFRAPRSMPDFATAAEEEAAEQFSKNVSARWLG
jgi:hypothetical protein